MSKEMNEKLLKKVEEICGKDSAEAKEFSEMIEDSRYATRFLSQVVHVLEISRKKRD